MSDNHNKRTAALHKKIKRAMAKAEERRWQLGELRQRILGHHLSFRRQMLSQAEAIGQLRQEIAALLEKMHQLKDFDDTSLEEMQLLGEQLANAPLFHPLYEEMLAQRALSASRPEAGFDAQLRSQILERLDEFALFPTEAELAARDTAYHLLQQSTTAASAEEIERAFEEGELLSMLQAAQLDELSTAVAPEKGLELLQTVHAGLKDYRKRLKHERKALENSPFGRQAFLGSPEEGAEDMRSLRHLLEQLKTALEDSIRRGFPSPMLTALADELAFDEEEEAGNRIDAFLEDMLDESEGLLFSGGFDEQNFNWEEEEYWSAVENPRFPAGSSVEVTASLHPDRKFPALHTLGWQGRVLEAYTDGETIFYLVELDSPTLQGLPASYVQYACEEEYGSFTRFEFEEEALKACVPRDTEQEVLTLQRRLFHQYFWGDPEQDDQAARILAIMMKEPAADDLTNWMDYFQYEVQFPFRAQVEGLVLQHIEPGTEVEVVGMEGIDEEEEFGLIASVKKGRAILSYPLMELMPLRESDPKAQPLLDYRYWADLML